jgi:DNA-binding NtrC family response regulator
MQRLFKLMEQVARSRATILVHGETGTGKELIAAAIHQRSPRRTGAFVRLNCASLAESLLESELFGHEKGAFTGAGARRQGRFEQADGGTLFLDEVSEISLTLQVKLLRFLQEKEFERVGGNETVRVDVRIVASTNRDLAELVREGRFREDLFYRLNVVQLDVPPLRARRSDIPQLVSHALRGTPARAVSEEAMAGLLAYHWPGNVRELFHVLQRAAVLCGGEVIDALDLPSEPGANGHAAPAPVAGDEDLSLHPAVARLEKQLILKALERAKGNRSAAARLLGIGRPLLYAKLEEHGIAAKGDPADSAPSD